VKAGTPSGRRWVAAQRLPPIGCHSVPRRLLRQSNCLFGLLVAWVLVRYRFGGRRLLSALIDLPFALRPQLPASR